KLSKNQLKKLKKKREWEEGREARKAKRKEKIKGKKERKREAKEQAIADGTYVEPTPKRIHGNIQVPITFIFDCDFEDLMHPSELISLASQLTRAYSDNRNAKYSAHLAVSSFGGKMKERFDGILAGHYESWKNVKFYSEDFVQVAEKSKAIMTSKNGGVIRGSLQRAKRDGGEGSSEAESELIYLSSDSDYTLTELKPYTCYVIGGLVDRNRHKGICYKRAMDRDIKTAKLPIGEYMEMNSRSVLTTNHVSEIMLKWLELGDWGDAFIQVIPKRKGGALKGKCENESSAEEDIQHSDNE
ncbi:hypothetical protein M501DRAFT_920368, partial [Patellaria atrata CBS 101060]